MPCYDAAVSWSNSACGGDVGNCRLEMLDGMDHHPLPKIDPPQSIEVRITKALICLRTMNPAGDWGYFLDGDKPRWSKMIIERMLEDFGRAYGLESVSLRYFNAARVTPRSSSARCRGPGAGPGRPPRGR